MLNRGFQIFGEASLAEQRGLFRQGVFRGGKGVIFFFFLGARRRFSVLEWRSKNGRERERDIPYLFNLSKVSGTNQPHHLVGWDGCVAAPAEAGERSGRITLRVRIGVGIYVSRERGGKHQPTRFAR